MEYPSSLFMWKRYGYWEGMIHLDYGVHAVHEWGLDVDSVAPSCVPENTARIPVPDIEEDPSLNFCGISTHLADCVFRDNSFVSIALVRFLFCVNGLSFLPLIIYKNVFVCFMRPASG
jgi:hypothetical protein